jgi:hypothetical protein
VIEISKPLTYIFNKLLKEGTYLGRFKYLLVKSIHKRGDNSYMTNYRPISLLEVFQKILETVILNRLNQHLQVNKILVPEQFIRKDIAIQLNILTLTNSILSVLNKQQQVGEIFCHLSRAFDYIDLTFICKIRIKGKFNNVTLINMYAPTEEKADSEKENFYEEPQLVIDQIPKSDTILVLGDANAKLGKEDIYKEVSGKHTLHNLSNRNGEMLLEFAISNNLTVMSTQFQHKKIHKGTWLATDQMTLNQTDHVLITSKKKEPTEDVRSLRGPNIDSDHYLLKIISQNLYKEEQSSN